MLRSDMNHALVSKYSLQSKAMFPWLTVDSLTAVTEKQLTVFF